MRNYLLAASGLLVTMLAIAPLGATAPFYRVTPQTVPVGGRIIVHDIAWRCGSGSCVAGRTGGSADATICAALARDLGPLAGFAVNDVDFDTAALEKCNRGAR